MTFLAKKIQEREDFIEKTAAPEEKIELLKELVRISEDMNNIGVNSLEDYRDYFYIKANVGKLARETMGSECDIAKIEKEVYQNREEWPINTLINFHRAVNNACGKAITKIAYPQGYENVYIKSPHSMQKWVQAMRQIYANKMRGQDYNKAFEEVTKEWGNNERLDFQSWLRFYQSGGQVAYKTANIKCVAEDYSAGPGYLPYSALKSRIPGIPNFIDVQDNYDQQMEAKQRQAQETANISEKINKLIGRLNSAEKLFTSVNFTKILGGEYDKWISGLHELKKILYSKHPHITAATVGDLIIRQGNRLRADGCPKAGRLMEILAAYQMSTMNSLDALIKTAQEIPPPPVGEKPAEDPMAGLGGAVDTPPTSDDDKDLSDPDGAMKEFVENLTGDSDDADDSAKKEAEFIDTDALIVVAEDGFYRFAQEMPQIHTKDPTRLVQPKPTGDKGNPDAGDNAIDRALKNITLPDTIAKLESIIQFHRNRQISRELLIVDLMLEALGIAAFFPSMAEAAKSSLDSNQYVLTRLEDVLGKLRGASAAQDGSLDALKDKLDQQAENQSKRREDKEKADMVPGGAAPEGPPEAKPVPEKELAPPAKIQPSPQPAPIR
jgi:hypothetical protein